MALEHKTDHAAQAKARLLQQYKEASAPGVQELVEVLGFEVQDLEDALFQIIDETKLSAAIGVNLEHLGDIVGQPRNGMEDETYWLWIQARIRANRSSGSIDEILAIFMLINEGASFQFVEYFPAAFALKVDGIVVAAPLQQAAILRASRKAGVGGALWYSTAPPGSGFSFSGGSGLGFGAGALSGVKE
jgi:hypothetical protein